MRKRPGRAAVAVVVVGVVGVVGLGGLTACGSKKGAAGAGAGADAAPARAAAAAGPPPICFDVTLPGPGDDDLGGLLALDDGGAVLAATTEVADDPQMRVVRVDKKGVVRWDVVLGGASNDFGDRVVVAGDGFVVLGTTWSSGAGLADAWLVALDGDGKVRWERTFGDADSDTGRGLVAMPDGGVVLVAAAHGNRDARVVRVDAEGKTRWEIVLPGVEPKGLVRAGAIGLVLGGNSPEGPWLRRLGDDSIEGLTFSFEGDDAGFQMDGLFTLPGGRVAVLGWRRVAEEPQSRLLVLEAKSLVVQRRQDFERPGGSSLDAVVALPRGEGLALAGGKGMVADDWQAAWLVLLWPDGALRSERTWAAPGARNEWAQAMIGVPGGLLVGGVRRIVGEPGDGGAAGAPHPLWLRRTDLGGGDCE